MDWIVDFGNAGMAFLMANLTFILVLMAAGLLAGFLAGMFGIGGGFVIVPALFAILGLLGGEHETRAHVAVGTSLATIVLTSLRSVHAHAKRKAVDFSLLKYWAPWIVVGVGGGLMLAATLDGLTLGMVFAIGVFFLALHMMFGAQRSQPLDGSAPKGPIMAMSALFIGFSSSLLGIGGGTLSVLVMTLLGRTMHQAVATSAGIGFIIAVPGTIGFAVIGWGQPDLPAGSLGYINVIGFLAISTMTLITAPLGVAVAHRLDASALRRVFAVYLMITSALMFYESWAVSNAIEHRDAQQAADGVSADKPSAGWPEAPGPDRLDPLEERKL